MRRRIGLDLGGAKIECIALDEHGRDVLRTRVETYLSGPGIVADHRRRSADSLSPAQIAQRDAAGDPAWPHHARARWPP